MAVRDKIAFYLDDLETPLGQAINLTIAILIFVSSGIFVAETYPLSTTVLRELEILDTSILIIFAIEYLVRLGVARDRLQFLFSPLSLIDLFVILPFFFGINSHSFILTFRWFRMLRIVRFLNINFFIFRLGNEERIEERFILVRILMTLFIIIFIFSGLIYQVEHPSNPEIFDTFLDALYFAIVTMTTVGFGDVIPFSETGRLLTILMILTGVALIPWQLSELVEQLVKSAKRIELECSVCQWSVHDVDAKFCKRCGAKLPKDTATR
ncbi:ion transporter [Baaleninema simplex]|uniref:ion transporter n=1 Tax=Baaleninema simplex TaxID=2862350 RepID=UPI00034720E6|nr:ion transporter [Baaleninema simplex]